MESKLTGTTALVTGASSGIGAATARRLAEHGAAVALVARRWDRLEALAAEIDQAGGTALVVEADITDRTQAEAAVQQAVERFGGLDTLVNNAGPPLELFRARRVEVDCDRPQPVERDGDPAGSTRRLVVELLPRTLTLCVPARAEGSEQEDNP